MNRVHEELENPGTTRKEEKVGVMYVSEGKKVGFDNGLDMVVQIEVFLPGAT
jgi:hypothetical protein